MNFYELISLLGTILTIVMFVAAFGFSITKRDDLLIILNRERRSKDVSIRDNVNAITHQATQTIKISKVKLARFEKQTDIAKNGQGLFRLFAHSFGVIVYDASLYVVVVLINFCVALFRAVSGILLLLISFLIIESLFVLIAMTLVNAIDLALMNELAKLFDFNFGNLRENKAFVWLFPIDFIVVILSIPVGIIRAFYVGDHFPLDEYYCRARGWLVKNETVFLSMVGKFLGRVIVSSLALGVISVWQLGQITGLFLGFFIVFLIVLLAAIPVTSFFGVRFVVHHLVGVFNQMTNGYPLELE